MIYSPAKANMNIHVKGSLLFLFIPLVLFLFLQYPFGLVPSFGLAILLMIGHRFIAVPFFEKNRRLRCFWCGRTGRPRNELMVNSNAVEACQDSCVPHTGKFFDFCYRYRLILRLGIFSPLLWYISIMLLNHFDVWSFPDEWNRFVFQFFIALTVVSISIFYRFTRQSAPHRFPFPIHNLFLLGARNTLIVFRLVGIWWLAANVYFLVSVLSR